MHITDNQTFADLQQHNYEISNTDNGISIKDKSIGNKSIMGLSVLGGVLFLVLGFYFHVNLYVVSVFLIFAPFIYDQRGYPKSVIFDIKNGDILTKQITSFSKHRRMGEGRNVTVQMSVRDSHVSAHEEGNQDYNYYLYYEDSTNKKLKIAHLKFRVSKDEVIRDLVEQINNRITA